MKIKGTRQQLFDRAVRGLASQGWEQSLKFNRGVSSCAYRGAADTRCAVGWLFDGEVSDEMNVMGVGKLIDNKLVEVDKELVPFLLQLQRMHDSHDWPEYMEKAYRQYAAANDLLWPLVDEHGGAYAE